MIESAECKSRKHTEHFQNYKSCGPQVFRKKRKRKTKRQTDKRCSKRHRKGKHLTYQRRRDEKNWARFNDTNLPEYMMPVPDYDFCGYPIEYFDKSYNGPHHDFECQEDSNFPSSAVPLNQLNLEAPRLKENIWKPKTFQYYSYFNEDESNLPELPETVLTVIWEFYPLFDFTGFRDVELPQLTAEAWKFEETKALDIGTLGLQHSIGDSWRGSGLFVKTSCKELEHINGFYEISGWNAANHNVYENERSYILEFNGSCWVIRTREFHMRAFVKDSATDPTKIKNRWTICTEDSNTIFEKRAGWGDKELPIYTAALKKVEVEIVSMTRGQNRLRKCKSIISLYEDSELLFKASNPEVALHQATLRLYKKFELRISTDQSCFYLRYMHFRYFYSRVEIPLRVQYWFKLSWNDMFDLLFAKKGCEPTGELLAVIYPAWCASRGEVADDLVEGRLKKYEVGDVYY